MTPDQGSLHLQAGRLRTRAAPALRRSLEVCVIPRAQAAPLRVGNGGVSQAPLSERDRLSESRGSDLGDRFDQTSEMRGPNCQHARVGSRSREWRASNLACLTLLKLNLSLSDVHHPPRITIHDKPKPRIFINR